MTEIKNMTASDQDNRSQATVRGDALSTRFPHYFFLAPQDDFMVNADGLAKRAECLKPYELSNVENAKVLCSMRTDHIIETVKGIFEKKNPQVKRWRSEDWTLYNLLLVDLCRRLQIVDMRFERMYEPHEREIKWRKDVIEPVRRVVHSMQKGERLAFAKTDDGEYFDLFVPFVKAKRERLISLVQDFGDELALFTEFIDYKKIADMKDSEYQTFVDDLSLCRESLTERMAMVPKHFKNTNPESPFKKHTLLNPTNMDEAIFQNKTWNSCDDCDDPCF